MEAIILIGLQASGKSTFYQTYFSATHIHINLDTLHTRNKEKQLLMECLTMKKPFVIDNTNPTRQQRNCYLSVAKEHHYIIKGYYLQSILNDCLNRNQLRNRTRIKKQQIPDKALLSTSRQLELPELSEGFDQLYYVKINANNQFLIEKWEDNHYDF